MDNFGYSDDSIKPHHDLDFDYTPDKFNLDSTSTTSNDENGDGYWENGHFVRKRGLHWIVTSIMVVGELAGGGLVALPTAMVQTEFYPGLVITVLMTAVFSFTAYLLGECWVTLLRRWPEYRVHCRKPYPEIGKRALGPKFGIIVSACIDVTQFGMAVVFLLLASKNIHDFLKAFFSANISFCYIILIVAVCLMPLTFLKSPADFWWAVCLAMVTTSSAVVLICVGSILDYDTCHPHHHMPDFNAINYFLALGTILFAYGGHAAFPTIQHDMKKPHEFGKAIKVTYAIIACMYTPACVLGYLTYGDSLRDSVINSLQIKWIQQCVNIFITLHLILTLTIVFNPINQEAEEILGIPHSFGIKRVLVRVSVMVAVVFVAESVPTFGPMLDLVGGSALTLTSVVFPALFYLYLSTSEKKAKDLGTKDESRVTINDILYYTPKILVFCCVFVMLFGLIGGSAATFSAIRELASTHFVAPCYVQPFLKSSSASSDFGHTNCCGYSQTIRRSPDISCTAPDLDFYK